MGIDRFEEGFDNVEDVEGEWPIADSQPEWEPECEPEPELEAEPEPEPELGVDFEPEPEPAAGPQHRPSYEEEPTVSTPSIRKPLCGPLGGRQAGDGRLGQARAKKTTSPFIKGPLCREWFIRAMASTKPALMVGLALWFKAGVEKDDFLRNERAESIQIRVDRGVKKRFQLSPTQLSRGLQTLKELGLVRIIKGGAGRCPVVVIVNLQIPRHSTRPRQS